MFEPNLGLKPDSEVSFEHNDLEHEIALEHEALQYVRQFAQMCREVGGQALIVGGCVRDELMGLHPKDFDIEVYGIEPEQLRELAGAFGEVNEVGAAFGILKVSIDGHDFDISLPRKESTTGQGHKDFAISADPHMSVEEGARRRDFTFNALAKDPLTGEIYDYFDGQRDIQNRILRITDEERFKDDPLRILRGMQFIGRFGVQADDDTVRIMREMREQLDHLPKERLREEWLKLMMRSPRPSLGLTAAKEWGVFEHAHPEIEALADTPQDAEWHPEGDVWTHTLMVVDQAAVVAREYQLDSHETAVVLLGALCHDLGKPETTEMIDGRIRSRGHEPAGVDPTEKFLDSIGIELSLRQPIKNIVAEHLAPSMFYIQNQRYGITDGAIKRLATRIYPATLEQLVYVARADHLGRGPFLDSENPETLVMPADYPAGDWLLQKGRELGIGREKPPPIIQGRDLISLGYTGGKVFGDIIRLADDLHVLGLTRDQIMGWLGENNGVPLEELKQSLENYVETIQGAEHPS